jgi:NAD(P)-dependent dehydrogenase (short-subunit alcohol dehydrogenase family)
MSHQNNNTAQSALVTGASRGIGFEVARQLAKQGFSVILTARDRQRGEAATQALMDEGLDVSFALLDITDKNSLQNLVEHLTPVNHLDVLINNAAAYADWTEQATTANLSEARQVMETNLFGPWRLLLPWLKASHQARIVNVSSASGSFGETQFGLTTSPAAVSYAISKTALNALTVKLADELNPLGIKVNAVDPGLTATYEGAEAMGARPVAKGAASVVWAAQPDSEKPTGGFFRDGHPLPW